MKAKLPLIEFDFVDDARTLVCFKVPAEFEVDAETMTRLVAYFAGVRARMEPAFPAGGPPPPTDTHSHVVDDADFAVAPDAYGVMVSLLHPGVGWIRCRLLREQGRRLAGRLAIAVSRAPDPQKH